jgi:hypothetical protein
VDAADQDEPPSGRSAGAALPKTRFHRWLISPRGVDPLGHDRVGRGLHDLGRDAGDRLALVDPVGLLGLLGDPGLRPPAR